MEVEIGNVWNSLPLKESLSRFLPFPFHQPTRQSRLPAASERQTKPFTCNQDITTFDQTANTLPLGARLAFVWRQGSSSRASALQLLPKCGRPAGRRRCWLRARCGRSASSSAGAPPSGPADGRAPPPARTTLPVLEPSHLGEQRRRSGQTARTGTAQTWRSH